MKKKDFKEYARLLRQAWLNPSHKGLSHEVHEFEHKHWGELSEYWDKWQKG